jgi:hypothetical protein
VNVKNSARHHSLRSLILLGLSIAMSACGGALLPVISTTGAASPTPTPVVGGTQPAVRLIFQQSNFTDLTNWVPLPSTAHTCLGDILKNYYASGPDYSGAAIPFPQDGSGDQLAPTTRPYFVKNVSVDMTLTYFALTQSGYLPTDKCSLRGNLDDPGPSVCASFDLPPPAAPAPTIIPLATATPTITPIPTDTPYPTPVPVMPTPTPTAEYYNTGYYHTRDDYCSGQGPVQSADPEVTKGNVGGVNIDIDRTQIGAAEDLLMMVTYHTLDENASWPGPQLTNDRTVLQVNLIATGQVLDTLMGVIQPRAWAYADQTAFPIYLKTIATLEDPFGSLRTEQIYIPLSQNALIDRIRIERVRGSYHLLQVDLYRLGNRQ